MKWFILTLACGHQVYVRLNENENPPTGDKAYALCGYCKWDRKTKRIPPSTAWVNINEAEETSDESVSSVSDGNAFVMRKNLMLIVPGGTNPYPYRN